MWMIFPTSFNDALTNIINKNWILTLVLAGKILTSHQIWKHWKSVTLSDAPSWLINIEDIGNQIGIPSLNLLMSFIIDKCKVMQVGRNNENHQCIMNSRELQAATEE